MLDRLSKKTYAIQHSPNCPKHFLVRLVGKKAAIIDYETVNSTDIIGVGSTLDEAITDVLKKL